MKKLTSKKDKRTEIEKNLDLEIVDVQQYMAGTPKDTEEYANLCDRLQKLLELRFPNKESKTKETLLKSGVEVGGSIFLAGAVMLFQQSNILPKILEWLPRRRV